MRITYDSEVDALYIRYIETTVTTKYVAEGKEVITQRGSRLPGRTQLRQYATRLRLLPIDAMLIRNRYISKDRRRDYDKR